jgi:hypothetical protein
MRHKDKTVNLHLYVLKFFIELIKKGYCSHGYKPLI